LAAASTSFLLSSWVAVCVRAHARSSTGGGVGGGAYALLQFRQDEDDFILVEVGMPCELPDHLGMPGLEVGYVPGLEVGCDWTRQYSPRYLALTG